MCISPHNHNITLPKNYNSKIPQVNDMPQASDFQMLSERTGAILARTNPAHENVKKDLLSIAYSIIHEIVRDREISHNFADEEYSARKNLQWLQIVSGLSSSWPSNNNNNSRQGQPPANATPLRNNSNTNTNGGRTEKRDRPGARQDGNTNGADGGPSGKRRKASGPIVIPDLPKYQSDRSPAGFALFSVDQKSDHFTKNVTMKVCRDHYNDKYKASNPAINSDEDFKTLLIEAKRAFNTSGRYPISDWFK
jgi:hypothetical protein